jgi:hypothetical protein
MTVSRDADWTFVTLAYLRRIYRTTRSAVISSPRHPTLPPVVFPRQANIAQGPQQVNNAMMPPGEPRAGAGETEKPQKKLLEAQNSERLDFGAPARQSALIRNWRPWEVATGPKSEEGKVRYRVTLTRAARGRYCETWRDCFGSKAKR